MLEGLIACGGDRLASLCIVIAKNNTKNASTGATGAVRRDGVSTVVRSEHGKEMNERVKAVENRGAGNGITEGGWVVYSTAQYSRVSR